MKCVLFFSKYEKEAEGAATYAHEILHLFGARDLYMTSITDGISSALVRHVGKKYPNDIMFRHYKKWENIKIQNCQPGGPRDSLLFGLEKYDSGEKEICSRWQKSQGMFF